MYYWWDLRDTRCFNFKFIKHAAAVQDSSSEQYCATANQHKFMFHDYCRGHTQLIKPANSMQAREVEGEKSVK